MQLSQGPLPSDMVDGGGKQAPRTAARGRNFALEYVAPLAAAIALTLVLTWPLPTYFTHALIGEGDATWGLGTLAYWREAFLGHEPLYYASRLYYPVGISFVTNAAGPFSALLALPFWAFGPAAAYNGAVVLGFALTGFCTYLLARDVRCSRPAAWLAGLMVMVMPLHVLAVEGHLNKIFLGFIALALLVTRRGMDPSRSRLWALAVGPMLVLAFLQAPEQFVIAGVGCGFVAVYLAVFGKTRSERRHRRRRAQVRLPLRRPVPTAGLDGPQRWPLHDSAAAAAAHGKRRDRRGPERQRAVGQLPAGPAAVPGAHRDGPAQNAEAAQPAADAGCAGADRDGGLPVMGRPDLVHRGIGQEPPPVAHVGAPAAGGDGAGAGADAARGRRFVADTARTCPCPMRRSTPCPASPPCARRAALCCLATPRSRSLPPSAWTW